MEARSELKGEFVNLVDVALRRDQEQIETLEAEKKALEDELRRIRGELETEQVRQATINTYEVLWRGPNVVLEDGRQGQLIFSLHRIQSRLHQSNSVKQPQVETFLPGISAASGLNTFDAALEDAMQGRKSERDVMRMGNVLIANQFAADLYNAMEHISDRHTGQEDDDVKDQ